MGSTQGQDTLAAMGQTAEPEVYADLGEVAAMLIDENLIHATTYLSIRAAVLTAQGAKSQLQVLRSKTVRQSGCCFF